MSWRQKSYDEVPALAVRGPELRRSLKIVTTAWMFGTVWMSCVSGSQFMTFSRMVGFTDWHFGIQASLPFIAMFGQFLAAVLIERTGLRKFQFMHCGTFGRSLWMAVAAVPLLFTVPSAKAAWIVLGIQLTIYSMDALSSPAWMTWMGFLIPRRIRGRYFAYRTKVTQVIQIVVVIAVGVIVDRMTVPGNGEDAAVQPKLLYAICAILFVGSLFGMTDILSFRFIREVLPPAYSADKTPIVQLLLDPLKNDAFRKYVLYGAAFTFTITLGSPYFWLNCTENLHFSKLATNVLFLVLPPITGIISSSWWGKLIDRWGRRPVLILGGIGTALGIAPWLLASPHTPNPQFVIGAVNWVSRHLGAVAGMNDWCWLDAGMPVGAYLVATIAVVVGGITWSGVALAQTGVVLGFSDGKGRSTFVAVSSALISIGGALGGVAGGWLAECKWLYHFHANPIEWGTFVWSNWHIIFAMGMVARMLSVLFLIGMRDPGAGTVGDLLRYMRSNMANNVAARLFYPLRVFGWRPWGAESHGDHRDDE